MSDNTAGEGVEKSLLSNPDFRWSVINTGGHVEIMLSTDEENQKRYANWDQLRTGQIGRTLIEIGTGMVNHSASMGDEL